METTVLIFIISKKYSHFLVDIYLIVLNTKLRIKFRSINYTYLNLKVRGHPLASSSEDEDPDFRDIPFPQDEAIQQVSSQSLCDICNATVQLLL